MASYQKFNQFVEDLAKKVHNLGSDSLKVMLTNTAPIAANAIKSDITDIGAGNGYVAGGQTTAQVSAAQTSGTFKLVLTDISWTASGGSIGPFRYAVLYNDTAASPVKPLIGFFDYGTNVTLAIGEQLTVDFDGAAGVLTIQ